MEHEALFKAFSNDRRRSILRHLKKHGEKSVSDISELIGLSDESAMRHLSILLNVGVLESDRKMESLIFRISSRLEELPKTIVDQI